jgi:16S rRNA (adenine1518-N6/adenine1519-N6)-dimethyltransferase
MTETKKSLGQHWLHDKAVLQAIVEAGNVSTQDSVLEIGPGLGTLTEVLVSTGANITALEFDQDLIKGLRIRFINTSQVKVIEGDIRTFNFGTMPSPYKIVANIPYYLTSHLIRSISETSNPPSVAVLLIQKEVAERLCALPGQMSILAVTAQWYFDCSLDIEVPAKLFTPPPKVDSQVVVLQRRNSPLHDVDTEEFFRLVKAGFSEKRKTLRNSLSGGLAISKEEVENLLDKAGINAGLRAQALFLDDWYRLYVAYSTKYE